MILLELYTIGNLIWLREIREFGKRGRGKGMGGRDLVWEEALGFIWREFELEIHSLGDRKNLQEQGKRDEWDEQIYIKKRWFLRVFMLILSYVLDVSEGLLWTTTIAIDRRRFATYWQLLQPIWFQWFINEKIKTNYSW